MFCSAVSNRYSGELGFEITSPVFRASPSGIRLEVGQVMFVQTQSLITVTTDRRAVTVVKNKESKVRVSRVKAHTVVYKLAMLDFLSTDFKTESKQNSHEKFLKNL